MEGRMDDIDHAYKISLQKQILIRKSKKFNMDFICLDIKEFI